MRAAAILRRQSWRGCDYVCALHHKHARRLHSRRARREAWRRRRLADVTAVAATTTRPEDAVEELRAHCARLRECLSAGLSMRGTFCSLGLAWPSVPGSPERAPPAGPLRAFARWLCNGDGGVSHAADRDAPAGRGKMCLFLRFLPLPSPVARPLLVPLSADPLGTQPRGPPRRRCWAGCAAIRGWVGSSIRLVIFGFGWGTSCLAAPAARHAERGSERVGTPPFTDDLRMGIGDVYLWRGLLARSPVSASGHYATQSYRPPVGGGGT